jgi:hypothetical protein
MDHRGGDRRIELEAAGFLLRDCLMQRLALLALMIALPAPVFAQQSHTLSNPTPRAQLRELSTDRPDKTESPYTVDAGRVQVELDFISFTRDRSEGVRTETIAVAPVNLKLGLTASTDIQFVVAPYVRQITSGTGVRGRTDGFGDVTVRLKRNLFGNDGGSAALAVMPFVKLPTNTGGIGNNAVELGLIVPLALTLSERVRLGVMTEVDLNQQSDGRGYAPSFVNSATLAFSLSDRLGLYTELFTERSTEGGAAWVVTGNAGVTYAVTPDLQIDAGVNKGLTRAADNINIFAGLSRRF